jgi:hypothetical protein
MYGGLESWVTFGVTDVSRRRFGISRDSVKLKLSFPHNSRKSDRTGTKIEP